MSRNDSPAHGELADEADEKSWDRDRDGRMRDHATPDDAVPVERAPRDDEAAR